VLLTVGNDNTSTSFSGAISDGAAVLSITKIGTGIMSLNNTTGGAPIFISGGLTIEGGAIREDASDQISDSVPVTIYAGGALTLTTDQADIWKSTTFNTGGSIATAGSGYIKPGPVTVNNNVAVPGTATISGRVQVAGETWSVTGAGQPSEVDLDV